MKQLDIKQVQERLLAVAVAVDTICNRHDIPLYMISGTMLGAVRHQGFIPWDDDMDFAVPYEHFYELIKILQEELPTGLRCLAFDSETYKTPWIKVEDTETIMFDNSLDLPKEKMPGLNIDIFPWVSCEKNECETPVKKIQKLLTILRVAYGVSPRKNNKFKNLLKRTIRFFMPLSTSAINEKIIKLMDGISGGNYYTIPVDPNYFSRYFPKEWFSPLKKYQFEGFEFIGATDYDHYLTCLYHDYMQLPPEEKRRVHCDDVFLK